MKKRGILLIVIFLFLVILFCLLFNLKGVEVMDIETGGVVKDHKLKGYNEEISSENIVFFEYSGGEFHVLCELKEGLLHVTSSGGNSYERDGSYFRLNYNAKDNSLLEKLQGVIDKYNISKNNGYEYEVAGLPEGLGDTISVKYDSGEAIWKYSNQSPNLGVEEIQAIYDLFHECAIENGYDFTSEGSNVLLYDDATSLYVQGTWEGVHFGREYKVVFSGNNVKIYEDGQLTDDVEYIIVEGNIVVNKLKDGVTDPKKRYDYEEFSVISTISKKNDFTMVAYFLKDSYSTCDLFRKD